VRFDNESVDPKALRQRAAYVDFVEPFGGKVNHHPAIGADEVMVRLVVRLETK